MVTHLLRCHLMMEPIAVGAWRQLPSLHPVWKLLSPHIKGIFAINTLGREKLIAPGGVADQILAVGGGGHITLMQRHYRDTTWDSYMTCQINSKNVVSSKKTNCQSSIIETTLWICGMPSATL